MRLKSFFFTIITFLHPTFKTKENKAFVSLWQLAPVFHMLRLFHWQCLCMCCWSVVLFQTESCDVCSLTADKTDPDQPSIDRFCATAADWREILICSVTRCVWEEQKCDLNPSFSPSGPADRPDNSSARTKGQEGQWIGLVNIRRKEPEFSFPQSANTVKQRCMKHAHTLV